MCVKSEVLSRDVNHRNHIFDVGDHKNIPPSKGLPKTGTAAVALRCIEIPQHDMGGNFLDKHMQV
jgi:hypothetical protein